VNSPNSRPRRSPESIRVSRARGAEDPALKPVRVEVVDLDEPVRRFASARCACALTGSANLQHHADRDNGERESRAEQKRDQGEALKERDVLRHALTSSVTP